MVRPWSGVRATTEGCPYSSERQFKTLHRADLRHARLFKWGLAFSEDDCAPNAFPNSMACSSACGSVVKLTSSWISNLTTARLTSKTTMIFLGIPALFTAVHCRFSRTFVPCHSTQDDFEVSIEWRGMSRHAPLKGIILLNPWP